MTVPTRTLVGEYTSTGNNLTISSIDLSAYDVAVVLIAQMTAAGGGFTEGNDGGWVFPVGSWTDGTFHASSIGYKVNPGLASLVFGRAGTAGSSNWKAIIFGFTGADSCVVTGQANATADAPSLDIGTGSDRDVFWLSAAFCRTITAYTAGPAGYSNFFTSNAVTPQIAYATKEVAGDQVEDPGGYTGGATGRTAGIAAIWLNLNNYTLTADATSFAITAASATLRHNHAIVSDTNSFALTAAAAGLLYNRRLVADTANFAFTGSNVELRRSYRLTADTASFSLTSEEATLRRSYHLTAALASFAISGTVTWSRGYRLIAAATTFALSGTNASLARHLRLSAALTSFTLSATSAGLLYNRRLRTAPAIFLIIQPAIPPAINIGRVANSFAWLQNRIQPVFTPSPLEE